MTAKTAGTQTLTTAASQRQKPCLADRVTKSLLGYGVLAGAVFEASILIQGLTRHGFSIAHDDASLLSNGPLGWIQIVTFLLAGAMTIAFAVGAWRALAGRAGGKWGPRLIGLYGAGLMAAGLLRADPAVHVSWHGDGHLISASIGFIALIAACFVIARYFSREGRRGMAIYSRITGIVFGAGFAGVTTGSSSSAIVLPFYAAVLGAFSWMAIVAVSLYRRVA
jgi:Protein of unknown function (DUF998)